MTISHKDPDSAFYKDKSKDPYPVLMWQSIVIRPGDVLRSGGVRSGCRAYVDVAGDVDVPLVLGSRSRCVAGKMEESMVDPSWPKTSCKKGKVRERSYSPVPEAVLFSPMMGFAFGPESMHWGGM